MTLAEWDSYELELDAAPLNETGSLSAAELERQLAQTQAELRRCQTRLFAYERAMAALRRENAELEAKCARARELSESLSGLFDGQVGQRTPRAGTVRRKTPIALADAAPDKYPSQRECEPQREPPEPRTELQLIADGLISQFDIWLGQIDN